MSIPLVRGESGETPDAESEGDLESGVVEAAGPHGHGWERGGEIDRGEDGPPIHLWRCARCGGRTVSMPGDVPAPGERASVRGEGSGDCDLMVAASVLLE